MQDQDTRKAQSPQVATRPSAAGRINTVRTICWLEVVSKAAEQRAETLRAALGQRS